jgi:hypothetical protein
MLLVLFNVDGTLGDVASAWGTVAVESRDQDPAALAEADVLISRLAFLPEAPSSLRP